jgi:hypothetical protein
MNVLSLQKKEKRKTARKASRATVQPGTQPDEASQNRGALQFAGYKQLDFSLSQAAHPRAGCCVPRVCVYGEHPRRWDRLEEKQ